MRLVTGPSIKTIETIGRFREQLKSTPEVRIEHAQMISAAAATKAKDFGVKLCMQPNFNQDSVDYADRLDKEYCQMNNPFRMLIDQVGFVPGADLILGSDGMPHGIGNAIQQSLFPSVDSQRLTIAEFKAAYCFSQTNDSNGMPVGDIALLVDEKKSTVECKVNMN